MNQQDFLRYSPRLLACAVFFLCAQNAHAQFVDDFSGSRDPRWTFVIPNSANNGTVDTEQTGAGYAPTQGASSLNLPLRRPGSNDTYAGGDFQANVLNLPVSTVGVSDWYVEARLRYNKAVNDQYNRINLSLFDTPGNAYSISAKNAGFSNDGSVFFNSQVNTGGATDPATGGSDNDNGFFQTGAAYSSFYDVRIARNNVATGYTGLFGGAYTAPAGSFTVSVNTAGTGIDGATNFAFATFASGSMFDTGGNEDVYNPTRDYAGDGGDRGELAYLKLNSFTNNTNTLRVGLTAVNYTAANEALDVDRFTTNLAVVVIPESGTATLALLVLPIVGALVAGRRSARK